MSSPLIDALSLLATLDRVRVVDCSHDLMQPDAGAALYRQAHVPGAMHAHLDRDLSGPITGRNGRHPLPAPEVLVRWLGAQGIAPSTPVVAYDRSGGLFAARLWWLLRWLGHDAVQVLDGGWDAWLAAGGRVSSDIERPAVCDYTPRCVRDEMRVDAAFVERNLSTREAVLVDARAAERYAGRQEPIDLQAGHIPGALNRPCSQNLQANGRFKPREALATEWRAVLGTIDTARLVSQCGSGVTACHNLLAMEQAGLGLARLYPGSWSEWCSDPARPVATGMG
jgi:thiosulfate/3-mercaptopyruvate sulfurtransferase